MSPDLNQMRRQAARELLQKRVVSLDPTLPFRDLKAVPHFYPFIATPYQLGTPATDGSGIYTVSGASAEGPDGISIPANQAAYIDIPVRLDRDSDYHLLWIKYTVYNPAVTQSETLVLSGSRDLLASPQTRQFSPFLAQAMQRIPYTAFLDVTVTLVDAGARDYYGGLQQDSMTRQVTPFPTPVSAVQLGADGVAQIRLDAQLPASGVVMIRATNRYTAALRLNGTLFGYKVSA